MEFQVSKKLFNAVGALLVKHFGLKADHYRYNDYSSINLSKFSIEQLEAAVEEIENLKVKEAKILLRDLRVWIEANEKGKMGDTPARSVKQAETLLIQYIKTNERKHIYRLGDGNDPSLAYYVSSVSFNAGKKGRHPEDPSVTLHLNYEKLGELETTTLHWGPKGCRGLTPKEMLRNQGFVLETPVLRDDYEFFTDVFFNIRDKIGQQFLCTGKADDYGVDGNTKKQRDDRRSSWWDRHVSLQMDREGPSRVVIDIYKEEETSTTHRGRDVSSAFWGVQTNATADEEMVEGDDENEEVEYRGPEIPIHPYVVIFDLKRHLRLKTHVTNLEKYRSDKSLRDQLVLPKADSDFIDTLLAGTTSSFKDLITNKSGGTVILCQGPPGTGKTLTSEIYSEALGRPLYTVQCSQLGITADELEMNLLKVLARASRWNAVTLLDEADVYVSTRGTDLIQNAIVGVFLRVLEYQSSVLFLTTNRGDLVDDAVLSRCTARITYGVPAVEDQVKIWKRLSAANKIELDDETIAQIVEKHHKLSGRDIKNLLKLGIAVATTRNCPIDVDVITEVLKYKSV